MSDMSQKSNCSEESDKVVLKRSMRSQDPEFVSKVKQYLNEITGRLNKGSDDEEEEGGDETELLVPVTRPTPPKCRKSIAAVTDKSNKLWSDSYCWRCHGVVEENELHPPMQCKVCPRTFHLKCLTSSERNKINLEKNKVCPECMVILQAQRLESRSPAMKKISLGMLCYLLKHALERMMDLNGVEPFMQPVDRTAFPDYDKYVVHPMDLSLLKDNINKGLYGSTEAFIADAQWILHNSIIFNTFQSKLTACARALMRSCRAEMGELEACPECYAAAHAHNPAWFTDVCTTPHILLWVKLKGFPYWPAKGMSVNSVGLVNVRFFGTHDRAWVPAKDCLLYSKKDPKNLLTKRQDIMDSMQEAERYIRNILRKYGCFVYPPLKTQFEPSKMYEQLKMMIPTFQGDVRSFVKKPPAVKPRSRSNSYKSTNESFNDGDASDDEYTTIAGNMADGAEIVKMVVDDSITLDKCIVNSEKDKETGMPVIMKTKEDSQSSTLTSSSRKRRRSAAMLEEAVLTFIDSSSSSSSSTSEKRSKQHDSEEDNRSEENEPSSSMTDEIPTANTSNEKATEASSSLTNVTPPRVKDTDPRSTTEKEKQRITPIRIALVTNEKRFARIITTIRDKEKEKPMPLRRKSTGDVKAMPLRRMSTRSMSKAEKTPASKSEKVEKPSTSKSEEVKKTTNSNAEKIEKIPNSKVEKVQITSSDQSCKEHRFRVEKRRNSRSSRSTNSTSSTRSTDRPEKKSDKTSESSKTKRRGSCYSAKEKDKDSDTDKLIMDKHMSPKSTPELLSSKSVKDRLQFEDDTTLADLTWDLLVPCRTSKSTVISNNTGLPCTITCVRSLSTISQLTGVTITRTTTNANTIPIDISEYTAPETSFVTPTSTENVTTAQDAVSNLQPVRTDPEPVGSIGVCPFVRMTSLERQNTNDEVQMEIKADPIEPDEADRHMEKMDHMSSFRLRPNGRSVGDLDNAVSPPMMNGIAERGIPPAPLVPGGPALTGNLVTGLPVVSAPVPGPAPPVTVLNNRAPAENTLGELTDFIRTLLEDLEQKNWRHQQEIKEIKHNVELKLVEMHTLFDKEKFRAVSEARQAAQVELDKEKFRAVSEARQAAQVELDKEKFRAVTEARRAAQVELDKEKFRAVSEARRAAQVELDKEKFRAVSEARRAAQVELDKEKFRTVSEARRAAQVELDKEKFRAVSEARRAAQVELDKEKFRAVSEARQAAQVELDKEKFRAVSEARRAAQVELDKEKFRAVSEARRAAQVELDKEKFRAVSEARRAAQVELDKEKFRTVSEARRAAQVELDKEKFRAVSEARRAAQVELDKEKFRAVSEARRAAQVELDKEKFRAVSEARRAAQVELDKEKFRAVTEARRAAQVELDKEKFRAVSEARRAAQVELDKEKFRAVTEARRAAQVELDKEKFRAVSEARRAAQVELKKEKFSAVSEARQAAQVEPGEYQFPNMPWI